MTVATLWTTRDGTIVRVRDMTVSHLSNVCQMLLRQAWKVQLRDALRLTHGASLVNGDMAQYAIMSEIDHILQTPTRAYLIEQSDYAPIFRAAKRRGIKL